MGDLRGLRTALRGLLAVFTIALFGTTLASCSYSPQYAVTLNDYGHVQVEWCFDTSVTVRVQPDGAVLSADGTGRAQDDQAVDLHEVAAERWHPDGTPSFPDDAVIEVWEPNDFQRSASPSATTTSTTTTMSPGSSTVVMATLERPAPALSVRVGDLEQGRYWYDGGQHSRADWQDECNPDSGLGGLVWFAVAGAVCFLVVVGVAVWGIVSAVRERGYDRR